MTVETRLTGNNETEHLKIGLMWLINKNEIATRGQIKTIF